MDKVTASKRINRLTGGDPDEMFCSRVHVQRKIYGGFWIYLAHIIDGVFYLIRRQGQHVRATHLLQRRQNGTTQNTSNQSADEKAQDETQPATPSENGVANISEKGGEL